MLRLLPVVGPVTYTVSIRTRRIVERDRETNGTVAAEKMLFHFFVLRSRRRRACFAFFSRRQLRPFARRARAVDSPSRLAESPIFVVLFSSLREQAVRSTNSDARRQHF